VEFADEACDDVFYMRVTSTLYRFFGLIGGPLQVGAFLFSVVLVWLVRVRPAFPVTLAGSVCFALSLLLWFLLVQPVNATWLGALNSSPTDAAQAYAQLRDRWEYGHVAAFTAWVFGFGLLVYGVVAEAVSASSQA
jgi:hypothetical protein